MIAWIKRGILILLLIVGALPLTAQTATPTIDPADQPSDRVVIYGQEMEDTLTDFSFFDRWTLTLNAGETVYITMTGRDGLQPLVGISDRGGNMLQRSDRTLEGAVLPDASPNGIASLQFSAPEAGEYSLLTSRAGLQNGTTTGAYTLLVQTGESVVLDLQPVEFRCESALAQTAITLEFLGQSLEGEYRISVFGFDGFSPMVRLHAGGGQIETCTDDSQGLYESRVTLPDGTTQTFTQADADHMTRITIGGGDALDVVQVTLGSRDGGSGRFLLVIEGYRMVPGLMSRYIDLRVGPANLGATMDLYMVKTAGRIDPSVMVYDAEADIERRCDDAGLRDCAAMPSIVGAGVVFGVEGERVIGGGLDAGTRLAPEDVEHYPVLFESSNSGIEGNYALMIVGEFGVESGE